MDFSIPAPLRDLFESTPKGREFLVDFKRAHDERENRKAWEAGRNAAVERGNREILPQAKRKAAAKAKLDKCDAASLAAKQEYNAESLALSSLEQTIANEIAYYEKLIREANAAVLRQFLGIIDDDTERLTRRTSFESRKKLMTAGYDLAHGPVKKVVEVNNHDLLRARVEFLAAARAEAERICSTRAEVSLSDLQELLADLPDYHLS